MMTSCGTLASQQFGAWRDSPYMSTGDLDAGLKRAIREYQQIIHRDGTWRKGPYLISDGISESAFEQWAGKQDSHWRLAWEPSSLTDDADGTGFCWLYGDPDEVHEAVIGHFNLHLPLKLVAMGAFAHVRLTSATTRKLRHRHKEPDWSLVPSTAPFGTFPPLVMEVAYSNESFRELGREVTEWVEGGSRLAIAVDIKLKKQTRHKPKRLRLRTFFQRRGDTAHSSVVDFSDIQGLGQANITITSSDMFGSNVPLGVHPFLEFDLFPLKDELHRLLLN